ASIVAKVTRDRYMRRADGLFPHYGFASHVGYITPGHSARVRERGPSTLHRRSFQALCYLPEEEAAAIAAARSAAGSGPRPAGAPVGTTGSAAARSAPRTHGRAATRSTS